MNKNQVYQLRQRLGMNQANFARYVYTTERTVQRWEAGSAVDPARFALAAWKSGDKIALEQVQ